MRAAIRRVVPLLLLLSAFSLQALPYLRTTLRQSLLFTTATLAALGILVTFAISLHYQGAMVWGVPSEVQQRYAALRKNIDTLFGVANPPAPVPPSTSPSLAP